VSGEHHPTAPGPPVQDFYADDFSHCYGCGHLNERGYQLKTRAVGESTVTEFVPAAFHTSLPGFVYGGLIASLIDCHSTGSAAIFAIRADGGRVGSGEAPRFVTRHLAVDYLAPTPLDPREPIRITGQLMEITPRKVIVNSELSVAGTLTARGRAVLIRVLPAGDDSSAPHAGAAEPIP
jgi:acyl-coenzyme A thioesterase PaaI-like protein